MKLKTFTTLAFLSLITHFASAQAFQQAQTQADQRLQNALEELREVRRDIADKKIPLAREVTRLENEVIQKRRQLEDLQRMRDTRQQSLLTLRTNLDQLEKVTGYTDDILNEFIRNLSSRIHISERPLYENAIDDALIAPTNPNLTPEQKLAAQVKVVEMAHDRIQSLTGGATYKGEAVAGGTILPGTFLKLGPTVYFADSEQTTAGIARSGAEADEPSLIDLGEPYTTTIAQTVNAGSGPVPFDASKGKAIKEQEARKSIGEYIEDGGVVGYVIIAAGLAALIVGAFKVYEILGTPTPSDKELGAVVESLDNDDSEKAYNTAREIKGIGGEMILTGVEHLNSKLSIIEEHMFEKILRIRPRLERFLPFMAIIAAAAPLGGLLGTVLGMIKTFRLITLHGTGDAQSLSAGISEALMTTALGLIVAIPVLILHGLLARMAKRKLARMEEAMVSFLNGVNRSRNRKDEAA